MNRNLLLVLVFVASTLAASDAMGQTSGEQPVRLVERAMTGMNQVRVSARMGYNISATLENIGVPAVQAFPKPPEPLNYPVNRFVSATDVTYMDGYVGIDQSGNALGLSTYWGYARKDQVVGDDLLLSHSSSGTLFQDFKNDPQAGLEVSYARQLGVRDVSTWGFETAFTYTSLDLSPRGGIKDPRILRVDAFPLGGVVPPAEPWVHPYEEGYPFGDPSIFAKPEPHGASIISSFDASIYGLKAGPYFEFPVAKRLSFALSGGFSLLIVNSEFKIQQSVDVQTSAIPSGTFTDSAVGVLPGAYAGGRLSLMASDKVNVFTGLQYESNGHHTQTLAGKRIDIDFWNALYWTFGVSYSF